MTDVLIRGGRIVTAADDYEADLLVADGRIRAMGRDLAVGDDVAVHDARSLLVLPGGVDVHTHLDAQVGPATTADTFETGTTAAAFGGTTTLVDYAKQEHGQSLQEALAVWHAKATGSCVDVGAHMIVVDVNDQTFADMTQLIDAEGVTSFKMFMVLPGVLLVDDGDLYKIMRHVGDRGALACVHAENGLLIDALTEEALAAGHRSPNYHRDTRPSLIEGEATHRAAIAAELAEAPLYVVHVSALEAVDAIAAANDRGVHVYGETCPHYLFLDEREYERDGFEAAKFVMSPPLRAPEHGARLWRGLRTGALQVIATDHCPFCYNDTVLGRQYSKQLGIDDFTKIPNGAPGVETRLPLIYDGAVRKYGLSLNRFVDLIAATPAKLFGLYPRKGSLAIGADADIVLFDPDERWTIRAAEQHSRVDYSLFEGWEVTGRVKKVFLRGQLIVDGDEFFGRAGGGDYIARGRSGLG